MGWLDWTSWVMALCGVGVLRRGTDLRRSRRQKMAEIIKKWAASESQRVEVERVFSTLVDARHYTIGLTAYHECARAERIKVGAWITEHRPPGFFVSLSEASAGEGNEILVRMERLADADVAVMAAHDFFASAPGWCDAQKTEAGPIIEDLDILNDIADTLGNVDTGPRILMEIEAFRDCVGNDKDSVSELGTRPGGGQIAPAQALKELDRITDEARVRTAELIEETLAIDASAQGRHRYARWKSVGIGLIVANAEYDAAYWSQGADTDIEYSLAATIRLTVDPTGVGLEGLPVPATGVLTATGSSVYLLLMYLGQYLNDGVDEVGGGPAST